MRYFNKAVFVLVVGVILQPISLCAQEKTPLAQEEATARKITWVIPFKSGGGADVWARFLAPHLAAQFPDVTEIEVKNVSGGGSTKAANRYAANPILDGSVLLGTSASTQFPFLLGDSRVRYDYEDWQVLLVYPTGGIVYVSPDLGITTAEQLKHFLDERLVYGSQGTTSLDLVPLLGFELLGLNVKPIFGIRGREAGRLALERGDVDIDYQSTAAYLSYVAPMVKQGKAIPLFSFGVLDEQGHLKRDPDFPELPNILEVYELIHGKKPSGLGWGSWLGFFTAGFGAQKLLVIPKETPQEIIDSYHKAIASMLKSPDYLSSKGNVLGGYNQVGGETAERLYKLATDIPEAQKKWVKEWLKKEYKLDL